jgi:L-fucose isomerase-like protein
MVKPREFSNIESTIYDYVTACHTATHTSIIVHCVNAGFSEDYSRLKLRELRTNGYLTRTKQCEYEVLTAYTSYVYTATDKPKPK